MSDRNTVVITGSLGALGTVASEALVAAGHAVIAIDRPAAVARFEPRAGITALAADVLDRDEMATAVEAIRASHGRIDGLLCLAGGFAGDAPVLDTPPDVAREQFELNFLTAYTTVTAALPLMIEGGGGSIVCVGARPAVSTVPGSVAYASSKLAVLKLVDLLAEEYRDHNIRANAILPSIIDTPGNRSAMPGADQSKWVQPSEIAAVLAFLLSEDARIISGAHIPVYGRA